MPSAAHASGANWNNGLQTLARVKDCFRAPGTLKLDADRAEL